MKRRKNLERAVILGLLLSTSVYSSAWAETHEGAIIDDFTNQNQNESFVVNGGDSTAVDIDGKVVEILTINPNNGNITINSNISGLDLNNSSVTLKAIGNNIIESKRDGIVAIGNSTVSLSAVSNLISVKDSKGSQVNGIHAEDNSNISINSESAGIYINVETVGTMAHGINVGDVNDGGRVELKTKNDDITINVKTGSPNAKNGNVYGIQADKTGTVILNSGKNVIITTESQIVEQASGGNNVSALEADNDSFVDIDAVGFIEITSADVNATVYGLRANEGDSFIDVDSKGKNENDYGLVVNTEGKLSHAVYAQNGKVDVNAKNGSIYINSDGTETTDAIYTTATNTDSKINLVANGDIILNSYNDGAKNNANYVAGIFSNAYSGYDSQTDLTGKDITITANSKNNTVYGIYAYSGRTDSINNVNLTGNNISVSSDGYNSYGIYSNFANVKLDADANNKIISKQKYGIYSQNDSDIKLIAQNSNYMEAGNDGIRSFDSNIYFEAKQDNNIVAKDNGIFAQSYYTAYYEENKITLSATNNSIEAGIAAIHADGFTTDVDLTAETNNSISAGEIFADKETKLQYGKAYAVNALNGSVVTLDAGNANDVYGAVYANGTGTDAEGNAVGTNVILDGTDNIVKSNAVITNAGNLSTDDKFKDKQVISALYAEKGAQITLNGDNYIGTFADKDNHNQLERTVWAYDAADITINGATQIGTNSYAVSQNSEDIAIAAGTATGLTEEIVNAPVTDRATVTLKYDNFTDAEGNTYNSSITGDILSAYAGTVDIDAANIEAGVNINGNLLAGNNGELNVNLGNDGTLNGRADDYGDAGVVTGSQHTTFFNPAFSSEIHKGGVVNLTMGDNSRWNVTGQSWITSITTDHEEENAEHNHIIDLISANTDRNEAAHALTVYNFDGNATFNMSLDADRSISDMLYIKNADGNYIINVVDAVTEDDIYAAKSDGGTFDGLRFATVGKGSTASFKAITYDQGFNNIEYMIGTDSYNESDENHHYNGESLDTEKPGDETVDEFFKNEGTPGSTTESTNGIATTSLMLAAANEAGNAAAGTTAEADDLTDVEVNTDETTNFKLIGVKNTDLSDGGETILNMSRANYSNAIYMDRLNKRLGEARYINDDPEEDEGMWVRIRHDRIGKEDAFRSQNTMYQLGYDKRQDCDNGERRVGFAVDYMHGDTGYTDIAGKGEIDRYGLWLYDTWMGDKGHYADYIAKWGHLDNDFEIYAPTTGQRIDGDYSNNVFSVSAEYGRKKDIGNDWYFEPQAQLQLARVTGADYTTSQGTKVSVDGINSLIGRAGFRIGKDFGKEKQSTLYFKADVLHEFLGDQDISAMDKTTNGNWSTISYENEGTWYDIGIGYAAMMSKSSYAFIDLEQSFGNDNDDTYQINAGVRWTF